MNLSMIIGGGSTSTPAEAAPPMPAEFQLGSMADSGTLMMSVDNEETALVGPVASSMEVRSARLGGGTPASTPLYSFRPLLPVINEEQHNLNQTLQHQQFITAKPKMLEMTIGSLTNEATLAGPSAIQQRDWGFIFRPRDQIINYSEGTSRRPVHRIRRRRRLRIPAADANSVETPQERIQREEQVLATTSSRQITKSFMNNLLQKVSEAVSPPQHKTKALEPAASASKTPTKRDKNPGVDQTEQKEIEKPKRLCSKTQTNESTFQKPRCPLEDTTMDIATKEVVQHSPTAAASENVLEKLTDPPGFNDSISFEKIPDLDTTIGILNISEINMEQPNFPSIEHMEIENSTANLSEHAIVTDVQILSGPTTVATSSFHIPDNTSNLTREVVELSELRSGIVVASELVELEKGRADSSLYHRESVEDLGYIVQHMDMLRLNIDRQTEISLTRECPKSPSNLSMPAVRVYDPKIVVNMSDAKLRLVHKLLGALVMQPQVDMRSADFIQNRMDAAVTFRLLLDLKAANIINLSKDGLIFSLK
ncbi:sister chromatid cohesion vasa [Drosophila serrata]|uniref:sister chromatid cohesion vasa n=1 Tax=Drosophila serrata TaxID=7274 RepID=UPI000A1CF425|nr:sister chromatid cohesion vasa [Drosophila serrata]